MTATKPQTCLDASHVVEMVHDIQPRAEAERWHGNFHDIRKFPLNDFMACAAFVLRHGLESSAQRQFGISPRAGEPVAAKKSCTVELGHYCGKLVHPSFNPTESRGPAALVDHKCRCHNAENLGTGHRGSPAVWELQHGNVMRGKSFGC